MLMSVDLQAHDQTGQEAVAGPVQEGVTFIAGEQQQALALHAYAILNPFQADAKPPNSNCRAFVF